MFALRVILVAALGLSTAACASSGPSGSGPSGPSGPSGSPATSGNPGPGATPGAAGGPVFVTALGRIAANDTTRTFVRFSDNTALRVIGGKWEELVGYGSADLILVELNDPEGFGIRYAQARYAVAAGAGPGSQLVILAGGQDGARVRTALTGKGWTADGDRLIAPKKSDDIAVVSAGVQLPQVRTVGDDVLIGGDKAPLDGILTDPAKSLAADPVMRSLAGCLGDVVLAQYAGTGADTAAVGVPRPSADGKIRAVVCSSFPSAAAATRAAERQRSTYATGRSSSSVNTPYAELYHDVDVKVTGQVVRVEATVAGPTTVLDGFEQQDVPGLKFS